MSYDDSNDSLSTLDRIRIERDGGSVRDLPTGGCVTERPGYLGTSTYDRHDAAGTKVDTHTGFAPLW